MKDEPTLQFERLNQPQQPVRAGRGAAGRELAQAESAAGRAGSGQAFTGPGAKTGPSAAGRGPETARSFARPSEKFTVAPGAAGSATDFDPATFAEGFAAAKAGPARASGTADQAGGTARAPGAAQTGAARLRAVSQSDDLTKTILLAKADAPIGAAFSVPAPDAPQTGEPAGPGRPAPADRPLSATLGEDEADELQDRLELEQGIASSRTLRFFLSLLLTVVLFYLNFASLLQMPLPASLEGADGARLFAAVNLALLLLCGLLCFRPAFLGLPHLFALRPSADSLPSLVFYAAGIGCGAALIPGFARAGRLLAAAPAALCLTLCQLGRLCAARQTAGGLRFLGDHRKYLSAHTVSTDRLDDRAVRLLHLADGVVCSFRRAVKLNDFPENAATPSTMDRASAALTPLLLLGALAAGGLTFYSTRSVADGLNVFALCCAMTAPLLPEFSSSLPLLRTGRRLRRQGALLTGPDTVRRFSTVTAMLLNVRSVFPSGSVTLSSVKPCVSRRIDSELIDAASLACASSGALGDVFLSLLGTTRLLRPISDFQVWNGCGFGGWVNGHRVMLGNRTLLRRMRIDPPSHDYEARVAANGEELLYLVVAGELTAVMAVRYQPQKRTAKALRRLQKLGVTLLFESGDPNVTEAMLSEKFDLDMRGVRVLSTAECALFREGAPGGQDEAGLAFTQNDAGAFAAAASGCIKLQGTFNALTAIQIAGAVLGAAFWVYAAFAGAVFEISLLQIVAFQGIWAVPVLLIALLRRHG